MRWLSSNLFTCVSTFPHDGCPVLYSIVSPAIWCAYMRRGILGNLGFSSEWVQLKLTIIFAPWSFGSVRKKNRELESKFWMQFRFQNAVPKTKIRINLPGRSALLNEYIFVWCTNTWFERRFVHYSWRSALLPGKFSFLEQPLGWQQCLGTSKVIW